MRWPPERRPLEGEVVRLEPVGAGHRDELRAAAADERIWEWIDPRIATEARAFHGWFDARIVAAREAEEWCYVTREAATGQAIGSSSYLNVRVEHDGLEIGWTWLVPAAWRSGANVEAKLLMLEQAFDELGCMRVEFKTDARNERSRHALAALPAKHEGVFRKHMRVPVGGVRDSAYYAIVDDEWPAVRERLTDRLPRGRGGRGEAARA